MVTGSAAGGLTTTRIFIQLLRIPEPVFSARS